ncbi:MAG: hypothetical protein KGL36_10200 [Gammaproteobacteria bacterium]|nr:hypothetical protein [Gammaproteobacteria bacterium]
MRRSAEAHVRLPGPIYESLPSAYAVIGAAALGLSAIDTRNWRAASTFSIGFAALVAALTIHLRRRDFRDRRRRYSGGPIPPATPRPPRH